jgi:hypothetical protein
VRVRAPISSRRTVAVVPHHHPARVARQALRRSRGNARAVLEDGLARLIGVRKDLGIDVDHYLVTLARGTWIDAVVESRLGEHDQCVRLLLDHRRRVGLRLLSASLLIQGLAGGGERLHEQRAGLRCQPSSDNHRAVAVRIHVQGPARVLTSSLARFGLPVHPPPAADDALDVLSRAGPAHRQ